uniref:Uncharacterized protein n=1 Tax=Oryza punctata TaxID=4537 RepID=A0A0E0JXT4_ORYPU
MAYLVLIPNRYQVILVRFQVIPIRHQPILITYQVILAKYQMIPVRYQAIPITYQESGHQDVVAGGPNVHIPRRSSSSTAASSTVRATSELIAGGRVLHHPRPTLELVADDRILRHPHHVGARPCCPIEDRGQGRRIKLSLLGATMATLLILPLLDPVMTAAVTRVEGDPVLMGCRCSHRRIHSDSSNGRCAGAAAATTRAAAPNPSTSTTTARSLPDLAVALRGATSRRTGGMEDYASHSRAGYVYLATVEVIPDDHAPYFFSLCLENMKLERLL